MLAQKYIRFSRANKSGAGKILKQGPVEHEGQNRKWELSTENELVHTLSVEWVKQLLMTTYYYMTASCGSWSYKKRPASRHH